MSKKKRKRQNRSSTAPQNVKNNLVLRTSVILGLIALVIVVFASLLQARQRGTTGQVLSSSDSVVPQAVDKSEANNVALRQDENSAIEDTTSAEEAAEGSIVEGVAADLPVAPEVGALAPDFALATIDGEQLALADVRGKPMFISFFHSW